MLKCRFAKYHVRVNLELEAVSLLKKLWAATVHASRFLFHGVARVSPHFDLLASLQHSVNPVHQSVLVVLEPKFDQLFLDLALRACLQLFAHCFRVFAFRRGHAISFLIKVLFPFACVKIFLFIA